MCDEMLHSKGWYEWDVMEKFALIIYSIFYIIVSNKFILHHYYVLSIVHRYETLILN